MRDRDGRVFLQKKQGDGTSDDRAPAHDRGACALEWDVIELQKRDDRLRGRGDEPRAALGEQTCAVGTHPLDVFVAREVIDEVRLIELPR